MPNRRRGIEEYTIGPNSAHVVYSADQDTENLIELYITPLDGSAAPTKLNGALTPGGDVWLGIASPDGQTVV